MLSIKDRPLLTVLYTQAIQADGQSGVFCLEPHCLTIPSTWEKHAHKRIVLKKSSCPIASSCDGEMREIKKDPQQRAFSLKIFSA